MICETKAKITYIHQLDEGDFRRAIWEALNPPKEG